MSSEVNGTVYCEHVHQSASAVTVCSVWCRHHPGGTKSGTVCPYAERQCVADHGAATFAPYPAMRVTFDAVGAAPILDADADLVPGGGHVTATDGLGEFGLAADAGHATVRATYTQRGQQYGDTWATDGLYDAVDRLTDALALVRVKARRILGTGGAHRDSVVDLIAYASAYLTWGDAQDGWWD